MAKSKNLPESRSPGDPLLEELLAAIGKAGANPFERFSLERELLEIANGWSARSSAGSHRRLIRKFRANTARRRELRRQLRPLREAIIMAGYVRQNPGADERRLPAAVEDADFTDLAEVEASEDEDLAYLIDSAGDFRKRQVRKLLVEPFLRTLDEHGVVSSRKLPRTRMMRAWFDWVGIENRLRPTDTGIRTIARDLKKKRR